MMNYNLKLAIQLMTLVTVTVQQSSIQQQEQQRPECSGVLSPSREVECRTSDETDCDNDKIILSILRSTPPGVSINVQHCSKHVIVDAAITHPKITLEDGRNLWQALADLDDDFTALTITNLCDTENVGSSRVTCDSTFNSEFATIDVGCFSPMHVTTILMLNGNCAGNITGNITEKFPNLQGLALVENKLREIPTSLRNAKEIRKLDLSHNILNKLTGDDFKEQHFLTYLNLSDNCLTILPQDVFSNQKNLEMLNLKRNNLEYFPENLLDGTTNLTQFIAGGNRIKKLPDNLFQKTSRLTRIDLHNNRISSLPESLLVATWKLTGFFVSSNMLRTIPKNLFQYCLELEYVDLNNNVIEYLPTKTFSKLLNLQILFLKNNHLTTLNVNIFLTNEQLLLLDLASNNLTGLPTIRMQPDTFITISLRNNNITEIKGPIVKKIPFFAQLLSGNCLKFVPDNDESVFMVNAHSVLYCENCCLDKIYPELFIGLGNRGNVHLAKNNITEVRDIDFKYLTTVAKVDLSENRITRVNIPSDSFIGNGPKTHINISANPITCDCSIWKVISFHKNVKRFANQTLISYGRLNFNFKNMFCASSTHLVNREVSSMPQKDFENYLFPAGRNPNCTYRLNCIIDTTYINCDRANLLEFPKYFPNATKYLDIDFANNGIKYLPARNDSVWYRMKSLNLKNNQISSLINFTSTMTLENINFQNNKLTNFLPELLLKAFQNTKPKRTMWLSGNPWMCNCEFKEKLEDIFNSKNIVIPDQIDLKCYWNGDVYRFYDFDIFCQTIAKDDKILMSSLASFIVILVLVSVLGVLFVKYKVQIKYFLYTRKLCLWWVTEEDLDADKEFDAFISYSSLDSQWVSNVLVRGLENEHPHYKVCVHERDWKGGALIVDQIVHSIENSRRTILVLTQNFLNSEWSRIEFTVAFQRAIDDKLNRVIIVVPNELPDLQNCESEFRSFVTLTTYIEFNKRYFWRKLRCSMPRRQNLLIPLDVQEDNVKIFKCISKYCMFCNNILICSFTYGTIEHFK